MDYETLLEHVGHKIEVVTYGELFLNVAIECETCNQVLLSFDKPNECEEE